MKLDFTVGKYTLESLTNGMYASPLDLYREYIQNAVDSFDEAITKGIDKRCNFNIEISLDSKTKSISIKDNGCGIGENVAVKTLLDIGNSSKSRSVSRGFRGIGRLAGLGYCNKLSFITTTANESMKTIVSFDTRRLKTLLISSDEASVSVQDVLEDIVSIKQLPEKDSSHYFEVLLEEVDMADKLINSDIVEQYLVQHSPLSFEKEFKWQSLILSKFEILGCQIKDYRVFLEVDGVRKELFKPYKNNFIADRVRKVEDAIQDISIVPIYRNEKLSAVLWYAQTNHYGTIIDNSIKGIRIRQGNILVGGKTTCNQFFKEERFNGWTIGELHIFDTDLIINSRRDDFEKNAAYFEFVELISEWSLSLTKEIRKKSYDRSLTNDKKAILELDTFEDTNGLCSEDMEFTEDYNEAILMETSDSQFLAENDFFDKLSLIINQKKAQTKYSALNINDRLTIEQRRVLERVFDVISQEYEKDIAEKFISCISKKY
jgi:molecular chaperone HtpG